MKKHLADGQLRAALDNQLAAVDQQHLDACPACQDRLVCIRQQIQPASENLSFLASPDKALILAPRSALNHFYQRNVSRKENMMFRKLFTSTLFRIGLAIILILVIVLSIPATRAFADQLLSLFRVQQVVVVPVDFTGMQQLTGNSTLGSQFSQLLSSSITSEQNPGSPTAVANPAEANQQAGFTVRLPQGMSPSSIYIENKSAFSFKVDRAKVQGLLDEAGRSDLVLPASVDGAVVSVTMPAGVSASYGTCPVPGESDNGASLNGSVGRRYPDCVILAQIPSPVISAPPDVNVAQLAEIGLEFTGMTKDQAAAFTNTVDWTSTLVIPIPKNAASYQQVAVDGVTGTLIQRPADDAPQYVLIWVKNGIIYAISSLGSNSQQAIQMANSLP